MIAAAPSPQQQLAAVHKALAAVQDEAKMLLARPDDRKRLGQAAVQAHAHTGLGTQAGCQAAIVDIANVGVVIARYVGNKASPNARAVALALGEAVPRLRAITWPAPPPPAPTYSIAKPFDTVVRHPGAAVVRPVTVARSGDLSGVAVVDLGVTGAAAGVLFGVVPAPFFPGDRTADASVLFLPVPALVGMTRRAAGPLAGTAALRLPEGAKPGPVTRFGFTVSDEHPPPPPPPPSPSANPFHLPGVDLGPLPFLLGMSMGFRASQLSLWLDAIGRPPLCCSGGSHAGGRTTTWRGVRGGEKGAIAPGTQLDIIGRSLNLSDAFEIIKPKTAGLIVACWNTVPDGTKPADYIDLANGAHDDDSYIFGWNAWLLMKLGGYSGAQLVVRGDKEYDLQTYGVSEQNAAQRARWLARFIAYFDKGYTDAGADAPARHVLGLARHPQMGPLELHIPIGPNGRVMIDAIDVSMHPPKTGLGALVGRTFDEQVAGVEEWIAGGYDTGCYAPNHSDARYSGLAVARAHGILISSFEAAPRDDQYACPISAAAWKGLFNFWIRNAALVAGVGVYNDTSLDRTLNIPGWAAGVDKLVALARGGR